MKTYPFFTAPQAPAEDPILSTALKMFSNDEILQMRPDMLLSLARLLERRLVRRGPEPGEAELQDLRELFTEHFMVPARLRRDRHAFRDSDLAWPARASAGR
jgi:hypothetical protein